LLRHAKAGAPVRVRLSALRGLQELAWTLVSARTAAAVLLACIDDDDADIVREALYAIARLPTAALTPSQWRRLLGARGAAVRELALSRLAADDTAASNRLLPEVLGARIPNVCGNWRPAPWRIIRKPYRRCWTPCSPQPSTHRAGRWQRSGG
jgi:hypothetical protein